MHFTSRYSKSRKRRDSASRYNKGRNSRELYRQEEQDHGVQDHTFGDNRYSGREICVQGYKPAEDRRDAAGRIRAGAKHGEEPSENSDMRSDQKDL